MDYLANYQKWLNSSAINEECREELKGIAGNDKEIEYRFGGELEFGTAGMRGLIGYGMNMMNI